MNHTYLSLDGKDYRVTVVNPHYTAYAVKRSYKRGNFHSPIQVWMAIPDHCTKIRAKLDKIIEGQAK